VYNYCSCALIASTHECTQACMHDNTQVPTNKCMHTCMGAHVFSRDHVHTNTCTYTYMHAGMHTCRQQTCYTFP